MHTVNIPTKPNNEMYSCKIINVKIVISNEDPPLAIG